MLASVFALQTVAAADLARSPALYIGIAVLVVFLAALADEPGERGKPATDA